VNLNDRLVADEPNAYEPVYEISQNLQQALFDALPTERSGFGHFGKNLRFFRGRPEMLLGQQ
jgi:hypothetical protein